VNSVSNKAKRCCCVRYARIRLYKQRTRLDIITFLSAIMSLVTKLFGV